MSRLSATILSEIIGKNDFDLLTFTDIVLLSKSLIINVWSPDYVQRFRKISLRLKILLSSFLINPVNKQTRKCKHVCSSGVNDVTGTDKALEIGRRPYIASRQVVV